MWHRTACAREHCDIHTVINAWRTSQMSASDAAPQRNGRRWREKEAVECIDMLMISGVWMIGGDWKTKAWLACKWVRLVWKKLPLVLLFTKKNCMQMVTFLPLGESLSILLLCRYYPVVANVFTVVSSPHPHYQWLTGRQHVSDIWCFQVLWISEEARAMCSWNNNVPLLKWFFLLQDP